MGKAELVQHWLDSAAQDLTVAESLFEKKHYDWCLFVAHLVIEKTLKAMWIRAHHPEMHPRIHNLAKLAEAIPLSLSPEQMSFLKVDTLKRKANSIKSAPRSSHKKISTQSRIFTNGS